MSFFDESSGEEECELYGTGDEYDQDYFIHTAVEEKPKEEDAAENGPEDAAASAGGEEVESEEEEESSEDDFVVHVGEIRQYQSKKRVLLARAREQAQQRMDLDVWMNSHPLCDKEMATLEGPPQPKHVLLPPDQARIGMDLDAVPLVNGQPIYDLEISTLEDHPWRQPGACISDYFNYGFNEESWKSYCERQRNLRHEFPGNQAAANKSIMENIDLSKPSGHHLVNLLGGKHPHNDHKTLVDVAKPSTSSASALVPVKRETTEEQALDYCKPLLDVGLAKPPPTMSNLVTIQPHDGPPNVDDSSAPPPAPGTETTSRPPVPPVVMSMPHPDFRFKPRLPPPGTTNRGRAGFSKPLGFNPLGCGPLGLNGFALQLKREGPRLFEGRRYSEGDEEGLGRKRRHSRRSHSRSPSSKRRREERDRERDCDRDGGDRERKRDQERRRRHDDNEHESRSSRRRKSACASSNISEKREKRRLKRLRQKYHEFQLLTGGDLTQEVAEESLEAFCEDPAMTKKMRETKIAKNPPRLVFRMDKLSGRKICHRDIADLLHSQLYGLNRKPLWCNFGAKSGIVQNVLLRINCADEHIVLDGKQSETHKFFDREWIMLDVQLNDRDSFWDALCSVPVSPTMELLEHFNSKPELKEQVELGFGRGDDLKLKLVNTIDQNISFHYPFPNYTDLDGIRILPSKEKYRKLSASSPLFALDCEMCVTEGGQSELTRISIIDEEGKVVLDTLVKPYKKITDYVTKFSGITHAMMKDVTVTLADVQKTLANILPKDAILVGHSLEFDLRCLRLSHPFCIDVALIYNLTGNEHRRTSLRNLCYTFLGEDVQGSHGHCSVEDAWNAMRLLKLKLEKGASFGNIMLGWEYEEWMNANNRAKEVNSKSETSSTAAKKAKCEPEVSATVSEKKPSCKTCPHQLGVDCMVYRCSCMKNGAFEEACCVKCSAALESAEEELDGDSYDYNDLLRIEHTSSLRSLSSLLENHKNNVLLAPSPPLGKITGESAANYKVFDAETEDCGEYVNKVKPLLLEHALCLLEMTVDESTKQKVVDKAVMEIANKIPKHALFSVIFVAPKRSVGYFKVK